MIDSTLSLLLEEMRDFKQMTREIKHEMTALRQELTYQAKRQDQLDEKVSFLTSAIKEQQHRIRYQPALHRSRPLDRNFVDILKHLPWLSDYPIADHGIPFIIDDIQKPISVVINTGVCDTSIVFFVNQPLLNFLNYSRVSRTIHYIYIRKYQC